MLLRGPSGAGKSDLALRLIDRGARLVADDQCEVTIEDGAAGPRLIARAPAEIAGVLEVRGLGIAEVPSLAQAPVALVVDLVARDRVERLPDAAAAEILGVDLPRLALDPFEAAAPAKLDLALRRLAPSAKPPDAVPEPDGPRPVVLVTGLSGAGRSTALKILEDLGYEAIDNLPLGLLGSMAQAGEPIALGIDIRSRSFAAGPFLDQLDRLGAGARTTLLFLDCDDEVLERRFTETRRPHPLAADRRVADGIAAERRLIAPLRARADLTIDTTNLNGAELRRLLSGHLGLGDGPRMKIFVTSFSYRGGLPREADLVFDARLSRQPPLRAGAAAARRARCQGRRLRRPRSGPCRLLPGPDRDVGAAAAALRARGQELPDHRARLHRRPAPLGGGRRATGGLARRARAAGRGGAPGA